MFRFSISPTAITLVLLASALGPVEAWSSCTSSSTSTYTYTNCSDGSSSISRSVGPNTYTTTSEGGSITSYQSGNVTYHTGPNGSGASYRTGNYAQHHWSDGSRGSSRYGDSVDRHEWQNNEVRRLPGTGLSGTAALEEARRVQADRRARYGHIAGPAAAPPVRSP